MLSPKYFVYWAVGSKGMPRAGMSSNPRIDAGMLATAGYRELWVVRPPQPVWLAEKIVLNLSKAKTFKSLSRFKREIVRIVACQTHLPRRLLTVEAVPLGAGQSSWLQPPDLDRLFQGRSLLGSEIAGFLRAGGYDLPGEPEDWLQPLVLQSKIQREAAVTRDSFGLPVCRRCGSTVGISETDCLFCGSNHCLTCHNCQSMGLAKSCTPLYYQALADFPPLSLAIAPRLDLALTPPQQRAAQALLSFLESDHPRFLVWAVCGSGKTEVSFAAVAKVLSAGGKVLFAIPRRDIVIELLPRFAKAFPGVPLKALYGGCATPSPEAVDGLTIATTHQCLRFYHCFDLVVLDEADAFPYQGSEMLHYGVERALKPNGKWIIMSATPARELTEAAKSGRIPYISIPVRYHRRPLIEPEIVRCDLKIAVRDERWQPPDLLRALIGKTVDRGRRLLIFFPTIRMIETLGRQLVRWGEGVGLRGAWTHARRDNRLRVKELLLDGGLDFLVTSTIFERGITIPDLDVLVLYADYEAVFDSRTLIQIAGRAGRHGDPASVTWIAKTVTRAMGEGRQAIRAMNEEARRLGYLASRQERDPHREI